MQPSTTTTPLHFPDETRRLFYQRTLVCLWLGVIFFSLFSLLDFVCCREDYSTFLLYRSILVTILFVFLTLLRLPAFASYSPHLMYVTLLLGALTISLMANHLGGFRSTYYVGILLMIAGGFSVLPLRTSEVIFTGLSMYLVYFATIWLGTEKIDANDVNSAINNSLFFFSIIGVTAIQSLDDLKTQLKSLRTTKNLRTIRRELSGYTDNLEHLVQDRLAELEESALKFRDLYNNILDLVVLVDRQGTIHKINRYSVEMLARNPEELEGTNFDDLIPAEHKDDKIIQRIIRHLDHGQQSTQGTQLKIIAASNNILEVELSGNRVKLDDQENYFQLIIRDISATKSMERELLDSERLIDTSRQAAIFGLAKLAECRDSDTGAHLSRIRAYTLILAEELSKSPYMKYVITEDFIEDIFSSSVLHDIGKVGIPDAVLLKPGKMNAEEFELMKHHCIFGSNTLSEAEIGADSLSFLHMGQEIARYHHERWDGGGYPEGLSTTNIPLAARIVALADVYDALTSSRPYKPAYNHEEAKEIILRESGGQFDPSIVNAFLSREQLFIETRMSLLLH